MKINKKIIALPIVRLSIVPSATCLAKDSRPNIIVILVDDRGVSDLGCYGGEVQTHNLILLPKMEYASQTSTIQQGYSE